MRQSRRGRPWQEGRASWCLVTGFAVFLVGITLGYYGVKWLQQGEVQGRRDCQREVARLERQRGELLARQARLDEALRLEQESTRALRETLDAQSAQIADLQKELAFYLHLARSASKADGRLIRDLWIKPLAQDRRFRFRVTLVRPDQSRRAILGTLTLSVAGRRDGHQVRLEGREIDAATPHRVDFRYFQVVEGVLELPRGFVPETVSVTFRPKKGRSSVRRFPWPSAQAHAEAAAEAVLEPSD